jgi:FkbM family methyltransferase
MFINSFIWTEESKKRNQSTLKHEPFQPFLFVSFLKHAQVEFVFDIGANIGAYSMMSSLIDSVKCTYAYEPDKDANRELEENILLNGLESRIMSSKLAVSDKAGLLRFGVHAPMAGVNGIVDTSIHDPALFENVIEIESTCLDDYGHLFGKTLGLKIDVEGHELDVLKGAKQLLQQSPSIIQVEHYVGSEIDSLLADLGYFSFFNAGHDHYFTNIRNFANPLYVKQAVQYASAYLIESQTERWPKGKTIKDALSVEVDVNEENVNVTAKADERFFFGELEYAFYLLENGKKAVVLEYSSCAAAEFELNREKKTIEVKAFVREKSRRDKKVAVSYYVKRPPRGYQPSSAVENAAHSPSSSISISQAMQRESLEYPDVNLAPVLDHLVKSEHSYVVQLGADNSILKLASDAEFSVELYCTEPQHDLLQRQFKKQLESLKYCAGINALSMISLTNVKSVEALIVRPQFLSDIQADWDTLGDVLSSLPSGCAIFTDWQVDEFFKDAIQALAVNNGLQVNWLHPQSNLVPKELVKRHEKIVPYPLLNDSVFENNVREVEKQTQIFISQFLPPGTRAASGDKPLVEDLGLIYLNKSNIYIFDLRSLRIKGAGQKAVTKNALPDLKKDAMVILLSDSVDELVNSITQNDENLKLGIVSKKHGVVVFY